jgi:hypothetical protein
VIDRLPEVNGSEGDCDTNGVNYISLPFFDPMHLVGTVKIMVGSLYQKKRMGDFIEAFPSLLCDDVQKDVNSTIRQCSILSPGPENLFATFLMRNYSDQRRPIFGKATTL